MTATAPHADAGGQGDEGATVRRCSTFARTGRGYERCHLDEHGPGVRHHVRDRSWYTGPVPRLRLGQPCGDACTHPEHLVPYLGSPPRQSDAAVNDRIRKRLGATP
jgi:hypothetical protein